MKRSVCAFRVPTVFLSFPYLVYLERLRGTFVTKNAVLPGQTEKNENAKAEKMHRPGTMNESFLIRSDLKMTVKFLKFLKPDHSQWASQ